MVGVVPLREALARARESNLDLVEVSPNANPPVCRIMDYGKFLYDRAKRERKARKAVLDRLELSGGRLLEVSIGTGANLPFLFETGCVSEVYGLDISSGQLAHW